MKQTTDDKKGWHTMTTNANTLKVRSTAREFDSFDTLPPARYQVRLETRRNAAPYCVTCRATLDKRQGRTHAGFGHAVNGLWTEE